MIHPCLSPSLWGLDISIQLLSTVWFWMPYLSPHRRISLTFTHAICPCHKFGHTLSIEVYCFLTVLFLSLSATIVCLSPHENHMFNRHLSIWIAVCLVPDYAFQASLLLIRFGHPPSPVVQCLLTTYSCSWVSSLFILQYNCNGFHILPHSPCYPLFAVLFLLNNIW